MNEFRDDTKHAISLFESSRYDELLDFLKLTLNSRGLDVEYELLQVAESAVERLPEPSDRDYFWKTCSSAFDEKIESATNKILNRDIKGAKDDFLFALTGLVSCNESFVIWQRIFDHLIEAVVNPEKLDLKENAKGNMRSYIFISGKGWSGSGAVFDYLSEFTEIQPIHGETHLIEGSCSVRTLLNSTNSRSAFEVELLRFFRISILGAGPVKNSWDFQGKWCAKRHINSIGLENFEHDVNVFLNKCAKHLEHFETGANETFKNLASSVIDNLVVGQHRDVARYVMLDNAIHISDVDLFELFDDSIIICVFRDPRSNYVALHNEFSGFHKNPFFYIQQEVENIPVQFEKVDALIAKLNSRSNRVWKIMFEDFVLRPSVREDLLNSLLIDRNLPTRETKFFPEESVRNVLIHESFHDQGAITLIESRLRDYCYKFT